jgi:hypothetical protein
MTGAMPRAGAASRDESGPDASILPDDFSPTAIRGLFSPAIACAAAVPAAVALRLDDEDGAAERFAIALVDAYGDTLLGLGTFSDEDAVAVWRRAGADSGLPLLIGRTDGSYDMPYPQIGRLRLGEIRIRRRRGALNGRRPRFLTRRKTGRLPVRPAVHREREIVSRGR